MPAELKYYKYKNLTYDRIGTTVGASIKRKVCEGEIREVRDANKVGKLVIVSQRIIDKNYDFKPPFPDAAETSKEEYDSIDVSWESDGEKVERKKFYDAMVKRVDAINKEIPLTMEDHLKSVVKSTGIPAATPEESKKILATLKAEPSKVRIVSDKGLKQTKASLK